MANMKYIIPITHVYYVTEPLMNPANVSATKDTVQGIKLGSFFNSNAR